MLTNIVWTDGTILFSASFRSLQSATMLVVRNNAIRRHCCDRMRNWSGRRGGSAETRVCECVRTAAVTFERQGGQAGGCTGMQRRKVYSNELNVSRRHGARPAVRGGTECSWAAALPRRAPQECEKLNTARVHSAPGAHTARLRPQHPNRADRSKIRFFYRSSLPPCRVLCLWTSSQLLYLFTYLLAFKLKPTKKENVGLCSKYSW